MKLSFSQVKNFGISFLVCVILGISIFSVRMLYHMNKRIKDINLIGQGRLQKYSDIMIDFTTAYKGNFL